MDELPFFRQDGGVAGDVLCKYLQIRRLHLLRSLVAPCVQLLQIRDLTAQSHCEGSLFQVVIHIRRMLHLLHNAHVSDPVHRGGRRCCRSTLQERPVVIPPQLPRGVQLIPILLGVVPKHHQTGGLNRPGAEGGLLAREIEAVGGESGVGRQADALFDGGHQKLHDLVAKLHHPAHHHIAERQMMHRRRQLRLEVTPHAPGAQQGVQHLGGGGRHHALGAAALHEVPQVLGGLRQEDGDLHLQGLDVHL
mmetsp:Transcript_73125/g.174377  ORF Transcript_73125/g.174377 Transcript_73125/m.174377 type:complete len:249 (+) Transcript_73125:1069-1815(+)